MNQESIIDPNETTESILRDCGLERSKEGLWTVSREMRMALALKGVSLGADLEQVVERMTWKDFEGFVASILSEHDYKCIESFRRVGDSNTKGMEIDVIGIRGETIIAVDTKMWGIRSGKKSALQSAAERQLERTHNLSCQLDSLSKKMGLIASGTYGLKPILVTWLVEDIEFHEGVPIIPVFKLNSFILDLPIYYDQTITIEGTIR
jgi:hypothetical protein